MLLFLFVLFFGFSGSVGKESDCDEGGLSLIPGLGRFPWRRERLPTLVFLPGELHGQKSLAGYSPWGRKELDTTEQLSLALSSISVSSADFPFCVLLIHLSGFWSSLWATLFLCWMIRCLQVRAAEGGDGITVLAPVLWSGSTWQVASSWKYQKELLNCSGSRLEGT